MGNSKSKQQINNITQDVRSIRSSIRSQNKITEDGKNALVEHLIKKTNEVNSLKGKIRKKEVDNSLKLISSTTNEVLKLPPSENEEDVISLDHAAVESDSFVNMTNKRGSSGRKSILRENTKPQPQTNRKSAPSLIDIRNKIDSLPPQISLAIKNEDVKQLRILRQTIKVLTTDLIMIEIPENTPLSEQKKKMEQDLTSMYRKIEKTRKDINRLSNLEYLSDLSKKDSVYKELVNLDLIVSQNTKDVEDSIKSNNITRVNLTKDNVTKCKNKLSAIEIKNDTNGLKKQDVQEKLDRLSKTIEDFLENNLISTYTNELKDLNKNYNTFKDREDVSQSISILNGIKAKNYKIKDSNVHKIQLINDIQKTEDKLKQKLSEFDKEKEGVLLRNKIYASTKSLNDVNDICENWNSIKKDLDGKDHSNHELNQIYQLLDSLMSSIRKERDAIGKKLNVRRSQVSFKDDEEVFNENEAIQNVNSEIIRTRAKIYNLPKIENATSMENIDKIDYNNNSSMRVKSEIRDISTKLDYIKEKLQDNPQNLELKHSLDGYLEKLNGFTSNNDQNIVQSAKTLINDINTVLVESSKRNSEVQRNNHINRMSVEFSLEKITRIDTIVDEIGKQIDFHGNGTGKDQLDEMIEKLLFNKQKLEAINVNPEYFMILQSKSECLKKIELYLNKLKYYKSFSQGENDEKTKAFKRELNEQKERVNRFSGTYKNVLYNQIEFKLNKLLIDVNSVIQNKNTAAEIVKDIEKYLKILSNKAIRPQSVRELKRQNRLPDDESKIIIIKENLEDIKKSMSSNNLDDLDGRLNLLILEIEPILARAEENFRQEIMPIHDELLHYISYVRDRQELKTLEEIEKIKLGNIEQSRSKILKNQDPEKVVEDIELQVNELKFKIKNFVGSEESPEYNYLDEALSNLTFRLDKLKFSNNTTIQRKKNNLFRIIHNCTQIMENRVNQCEALAQIELRIHNIEDRVYSISSYEEKELLDEELTGLQIKIEQVIVDQDLEYRKILCKNKLQAFLKNVREINEFDIEGTLV